jgi:hypothetical protein
MTPEPLHLANKQLYIEHLADRLHAMELGEMPTHPIAYRLCARRLKQALAGFPVPRLALGLADMPDTVTHALADRHFDSHGSFPGPYGDAAKELAAELMVRLQRLPD